MFSLLRDVLFPIAVFLHAVLIGAPRNHGRGRFQHAAFAVRRVGRLSSAQHESSGLARGDVPGTIWNHGDSGAAARLTLISLSGTELRSLNLAPLQNTDWEDLAQDAAGYLYIGDFGNNDNKRRDLVIYRLNPRQARPQVDTIAFNYPDQRAFPPQWSRRNFDCEAFFWLDDTLHLFSKDRSYQQWTKHYLLPAKPGHYVAILRDSLRLNTPITAADISPDGRTVVLLGYGGLFLFARQPGQKLFDSPKSFRALPTTGQAEGLIFLTDSTLLVSNEKGRLYQTTRRARKLGSTGAPDSRPHP